MLAAGSGHPVTFVERPADIRLAHSAGLTLWLSGLAGGREALVSPRLAVKPRSTILPGHLNVTAARANGLLLRRTLKAYRSDRASIVCNWPWDWPAVAATPARRRVFDMADDWGELLPGRRRWFQHLYDRIAAEADEITIVNQSLAQRFAGRQPLVIRNGVDEAVLDMPRVAPEPRTMVYVGTLTPRFDAQLMRGVLAALPSWTLDLVGACSYPRHGNHPAPDLQKLLDLADRVRWHGPMPRALAIEFLDRAAVAVVPNRPERSLGQDSMKFYDYAARGRPIVSTRWFDGGAGESPPHLELASTASEFADAVTAAANQPQSAAEDRRRWAAGQTWRSRWKQWSDAVFAE
jgi:glycosyltransferase involved in cell wall biosynthesis